MKFNQKGNHTISSGRITRRLLLKRGGTLGLAAAIPTVPLFSTAIAQQSSGNEQVIMEYWNVEQLVIFDHTPNGVETDAAEAAALLLCSEANPPAVVNENGIVAVDLDNTESGDVGMAISSTRHLHEIYATSSWDAVHSTLRIWVHVEVEIRWN